jgi:hypothetical protein
VPPRNVLVCDADGRSVCIFWDNCWNMPCTSSRSCCMSDNKWLKMLKIQTYLYTTCSAAIARWNSLFWNLICSSTFVSLVFQI